MSKYKYTDRELAAAVAKSVSISQTMRLLGYTKIVGGSICCLRNKIDRLGIDRTHFTGQAWARGIPKTTKKTAADILVYTESMNRPRRNQLMRALVEVGRLVECEGCHVGSIYNGKPITLHIDHRDGNWNNNSEHNLRFLCPNCHSQTNTYGNKKRNIMPR